MIQNRKEFAGGLDLLSASEGARPANSNGITQKNGHGSGANGRAKTGGRLLPQLRAEFKSDDPFPFGLEPLIESKKRFVLPAKNASPWTNNIYLNPNCLFSGSGFSAKNELLFHASENGRTPDYESSNGGYSKTGSAFHRESAIQTMPVETTDAATEETPQTGEYRKAHNTPVSQLVDTAVPLNQAIPTEPAIEEEAYIDEPGDSSPYRTARLAIPKNGPVFPFDGVDPRVAEQYRILRTSILLHANKPKVIAISSGSSGDGKTLTAINFAGILAMKEEVKVLIVDADLRKCSLGTTLGIDSSLGLAEVLNGEASLEQAIVRAEQLPNFYILPSGDVKQNPAELIDSAQFRQFVEDVRQQFTYVVFDTTPAASVADFKLVMQVCDGVLMVVRPEHTERQAFQRALELVPAKKCLGAVINAFEDWFLWNKMDSNYYYSVGSNAATQSRPFFRWRRRAPQSLIVKKRNLK